MAWKSDRNAVWIVGALRTLKQAASKQPLPTLPPNKFNRYGSVRKIITFNLKKSRRKRTAGQLQTFAQETQIDIYSLTCQFRFLSTENFLANQAGLMAKDLI